MDTSIYCIIQTSPPRPASQRVSILENLFFLSDQDSGNCVTFDCALSRLIFDNYPWEFFFMFSAFYHAMLGGNNAGKFPNHPWTFYSNFLGKTQRNLQLFTYTFSASINSILKLFYPDLCRKLYSENMRHHPGDCFTLKSPTQNERSRNFPLSRKPAPPMESFGESFAQNDGERRTSGFIKNSFLWKWKFSLLSCSIFFSFFYICVSKRRNKLRAFRTIYRHARG